MTDGQKIQEILRHICSADKDSIDTGVISKALELSLPETNSLVRRVIEQGDILDCSTKDTIDIIELLRTKKTSEAFESKKYFIMTDKEIILQTLDRLKKFDGFSYLPTIFNQIGITDNIKQEHFRDILLQKGLTQKSNHSNWNQQITESGIRLDGVSYDNLFNKSDFRTGDIKLTTSKGDLVLKTGDVTDGGKSGDINITSGHIGDKNQDSSFRNFKTSKLVANNPPIKNPSAIKSIWLHVLHWWWTYLIGVLIVLTGLAVEHDWFNIINTK